MLGHKINLSKFKKTEIITTIFSDYSGMKLEINYKNKTKTTDTWKFNNMLLNNYWVIEEVKGEIKKCLEMNENRNATYHNLWNATKVVLKGKLIAI